MKTNNILGGMMEKTDALKKATKIAELITEGERKLGRVTMKELPLLSYLPLLKLRGDAEKGKKLDLKILNPRVNEILIFGSLAENESGEVNDIDMMVLDSGFYSTFFAGEGKGGDWYEELSENLDLLLGGFFDLPEERYQDILDTTVDLHVLPLEMIRSVKLRKDVARKHKDPNFLKHCFSRMLRYDKFEHRFIPIDVRYFEEKYGATLPDLK